MNLIHVTIIVFALAAVLGLNALGIIPEDYRIVFTLREINGLSVLDTTEVLGISGSNVKVRLNRAKKILRAELKKCIRRKRSTNLTSGIAIRWWNV